MHLERAYCVWNILWLYNALLSMNGNLTTQYCPGVDIENDFVCLFLLLSHEIALKAYVG